jgi:hypothetical protein
MKANDNKASASGRSCLSFYLENAPARFTPRQLARVTNRFSFPDTLTPRLIFACDGVLRVSFAMTI